MSTLRRIGSCGTRAPQGRRGQAGPVRPHRPALAARPRRRCDRIAMRVGAQNMLIENGRRRLLWVKPGLRGGVATRLLSCHKRPSFRRRHRSQKCQEPTFRGTISNTENRGVPRRRGVGRVCGPRCSRMLAGRHCIVCKTICRLSMHPQLEDMSVPKEILRSSECRHISLLCRDPLPRDRASDDPRSLSME